MQLNKLMSSRIIFVIMKTDYFFPLSCTNSAVGFAGLHLWRVFFLALLGNSVSRVRHLGHVAQQILVAMQNPRNILSMHHAC